MVTSSLLVGLDVSLPQVVIVGAPASPIPVVVDAVVLSLSFQTGLTQMMRRTQSRVTVVVVVVCDHKTSQIDSLVAPEALLVAMVVTSCDDQPL